MMRIREVLPPGLAFVRRSVLFTRETAPNALLSAHCARRGMWSLLRGELEALKLVLVLAAAIASVRWTPVSGGAAMKDPHLAGRYADGA